jgi:bifunctional DNase/RNase
MNRLPVFLLLSGLAFFLPCASTSAAAEPDRVRIQNVEVRITPLGTVVLLKVRNKAIPVFVDAIVAESIQASQAGRKTPRPLTHDLMHTILEAYDGKVTQVVVTLKERVFHAALTVIVGKTAKVFDSRSSDAIALAIHFKAPILVDQDLLDSAGVDLEQPGARPETRT